MGKHFKNSSLINLEVFGFLNILSYFVTNSSVQFSCSVMSNSLRPHESQHAKLIFVLIIHPYNYAIYLARSKYLVNASKGILKNKICIMYESNKYTFSFCIGVCVCVWQTFYRVLFNIIIVFTCISVTKATRT